MAKIAGSLTTLRSFALLHVSLERTVGLYDGREMVATTTVALRFVHSYTPKKLNGAIVPG